MSERPNNGDTCRVVHLTWDHDQEAFDAVVRAQTPSGVVVTRLHDYVALAGLLWIRADELGDVKELERDHPATRLADMRGTRSTHVSASLTDLKTLLDELAESGQLVMVHETDTGSGAGLVGHITELEASRLVLADVNPEGRRTDEELEFDIDEIIAVEWGTDYLTALGDLLASE